MRNKYIPMHIPNHYDARVKLSPEDKEEVVRLHKTGKFSQRQLARRFGVSRRLIQFIIDPEKLARHKKLFRERQATGRYYDKDKHRVYMQKHRLYKGQLGEEGKLLSD